MSRKIDFINPFGTAAYDEIIEETLRPYAGAETHLRVSHLEGCPANIDYFYNKHLMEAVVFERVMQAEKQDFDAVVIGCCYDPGVLVARELVDIPVVGPLEAAMQMANYFGHDYVIITDHHKAVPYLRDLVRLYGVESKCRGVRCIDWWVTDMIQKPDAVAQDAVRAAREALEHDGAESVILGCTIIGACLERHLLHGGGPRDLPILNPNILALKMAEALADLKQRGAYTISRRGYYAKPQDHDPAELQEVRRRFGVSLGVQS